MCWPCPGDPVTLLTFEPGLLVGMTYLSQGKKIVLILMRSDECLTKCDCHELELNCFQETYVWISFELSDMSDTSFCSCMRKGVVNEMKLVLGAENLKVMVKKKIQNFPHGKSRHRSIFLDKSLEDYLIIFKT